MREVSLRNWGVRQVTEEESVFNKQGRSERSLQGKGAAWKTCLEMDGAKGAQGCWCRDAEAGIQERWRWDAASGILVRKCWTREQATGKWLWNVAEAEGRSLARQSRRQWIKHGRGQWGGAHGDHVVRFSWRWDPTSGRGKWDPTSLQGSDSCWPWGICDSKCRLYPEENRSHWTVF